VDPVTPPALELDHLWAGYVAGIDVVQDVSLRVPAGGFYGVVGLNGAGKSTLLRAITGFLAPRAGRVRLLGRDITGIAPHRCLTEGVYLLPQESSLFPYLTVAENLALVARRRGTPLEEVHRHFPALASYWKSRAGDLSGGWQKMVECAKAVLARPRVLLVDEPAVGLAPGVAREVYAWIARAHAEGTTVLLVDHNVQQVLTMTEYLYVLNLGRVVAEGPCAHFLGDVRGHIRQWLGLGGVPSAS
jgi:branched-chain amino acid transport system ATP-binding protein